MADKFTASAAQLKPDHRTNSKLASKFINCLMHDGKKSVAINVFYDAMDIIVKKMPDEDAVRSVFRMFVENGVRFTIATDGPEMMRTHLRDELDMLLRIGALGQEELDEANVRGHESSFVRGRFRAARV